MEIIKANKPKLIRWLRGDELILQHVQSRNLITANEYDMVNSIPDPSQKTTKILDLMLGKGDGICRAFLEMLKDDDVNESSPELKKWIATVDTSSSAHSSACSSSVAVPNNTGQSTSTTVNIQAHGGSNVNAPVMCSNNIKTLNTNINMNPTSQTSLDDKLISDSEEFLRKNQYNLVQRVKNVAEIVDQLNFRREMMANVQAEPTDQKKMRNVLEYTNSRTASDLLIEVLMKHDPDLMKELTST
ncbi:uncharacterized protein si:dkey-10c21.1 [Trichomycterus rosablanca]|uniref:uncharacterized protein si:dkey-10c21.1 n=1 Tax=Trichomycterus rosablanca TaxID=2290929 RepID=UPI002F353B13